LEPIIGKDRNREELRVMTYISPRLSILSRSSTREKADEPQPIDAALYLETLCRLFASAHPREAIACTVEDHGAGMVPEAVCRMLGLALCELIDGARTDVSPLHGMAPLTVLLRRRGSIVLCAIAGESLTSPSFPSALPCSVEMAELLRDICILRWMPERGMVAIMLDADAAERRITAAVSGYRAARARHASWAVCGELDA
jgi:hypothetical protein